MAIKQNHRNAVLRLFHAKNDKEAIAGWKLDFNRILHVFNVCSNAFPQPPLIVPFQTELAMNTHVTVADIRLDVSRIRAEICGQVRVVSTTPIRSVNPRRGLQFLRHKPGQQLRKPRDAVP